MSPHHSHSQLHAAFTATGDTLHTAFGQVGRAFAWVELAMRVHRERRDLARLDDHMLKDIGLDRGQAFRETTRDFADLPRRRVSVRA